MPPDPAGLECPALGPPLLRSSAEVLWGALGLACWVPFCAVPLGGEATRIVMAVVLIREIGLQAPSPHEQPSFLARLVPPSVPYRL